MAVTREIISPLATKVFKDVSLLLAVRYKHNDVVARLRVHEIFQYVASRLARRDGYVDVSRPSGDGGGRYDCLALSHGRRGRRLGHYCVGWQDGRGRQARHRVLGGPVGLLHLRVLFH